MKLFAFEAAEVSAIIKDLDKPLFVYRLGTAAASFKKLRAVMSERVRIAYALKANPGLPLITLFNAFGASFDCASAGELERLSSLSIPGQRLLFAGPAKSRRDLSCAIAAGARVQVDSLEDLQTLSELLQADCAMHPVKVNLRVHPLVAAEEKQAIIGGSGPAVFGVDEENLLEFLDRARDFKKIFIAGLQVFTASNELDYLALLSRYQLTFQIARKLQEQCGHLLDCIDLGGGLGIPYSPDDPELDIEALGSGLEKLINEQSWFKGEVVIEPGRWLAGPCGVYLAPVIRTKVSRGVSFMLLQEGINHLLRPLLTGQAFPVCPAGTAVEKSVESGTERLWTLAGPLCTGLDRLGQAMLPDMHAGAVLMFGQTGAYGRTEAMNGFLCRDEPGELWLD